MDKRMIFDITKGSLLELGVNPDIIVEKIAKMDAREVKPVYVKGYLTLIHGPKGVSSS
ncbi:hypothetical protein MKZ12_07070 [Paenibacillus sp. FSL R5-0713]|uniref:hypothetical protein n=1 Tax=Paenibacillus sp. FSL R5-0713 TaxID=2921655 RepID=UPI0030DC0B15